MQWQWSEVSWARPALSPGIPEPKWMRWRTYDRHLEQIARAEEIIDGHLAAFLYKLDPSLGR
jgi:hypothetical protein